MKQIYLLSLFAVSLCITLPASSQQAAKDTDKKVVVIKKVKTKDGETQVEKIILRGEDTQIRFDPELNFDEVEEIEIVKTANEGDIGEIEIGDIEIGDIDVGEIEVDVELADDERVITIVRDGEESTIILDGVPDSEEGDRGFGNMVHELTGKVARMEFHPARGHRVKTKEHSNCVALGVFVNSSHGGARVSGVIDGSGAEEAGMDRGDLITAIGEDDVRGVRSLHEALGKYEPGDVVAVTFERDGETKSLDTELRAWGDLPDYKDSWRANVNCGDDEYRNDFDFLETPVEKRITIIKKNAEQEEEDVDVVEETQDEPLGIESTFDYQLALESYTVFPNPSSGQIRVQFEADPRPLTVSVFDASGREVYQDRMTYFNGFYNREIDLSDQPRGTLVLTVVQDGKRFSDVIILQ